MKNSFIKQIIGLSSVCLFAQMTMAASTSDSLPQNEKIKLLEERIDILEHKHQEDIKNKPIDPVLALPQVNFREKYDTAPPYDQDLTLLKMRKGYENELKERDIIPLPYPRIELGGSVIGLGTMRKPPKVPPANGKMQSDLTLSGANLNVTAEMMQELMGSLRISYNPNGPERFNESTITTRVANSAIFLNTAFLTLGDLNRFPFYLSAGQMFLPFGAYSSSLVVAPLTARVGRMKQRPLLLGYQGTGATSAFNASIFGFKGDAFVDKHSGVLNNGGANLGYKFSHSLFSINAGASVISNIADAGGMQNTGPSTIVSDAGDFVDNDFLDEDDEDEDADLVIKTFRGFGAKENLVHKVPAVNARARLALVPIPISFYGEMVRPTRPFAIENMSFNDGGARPSAWNAEAAIRFPVFDNPSSISVGYGRSQQGLALNLPRYSTGGAFRIKFKRFLSCALGYQYDVAYPLDSFATGQLFPVNANKFVGTVTHTVVAQVTGRF